MKILVPIATFIFLLLSFVSVSAQQGDSPPAAPAPLAPDYNPN
jgi:hypothetical protein